MIAWHIKFLNNPSIRSKIYVMNYTATDSSTVQNPIKKARREDFYKVNEDVR